MLTTFEDITTSQSSAFHSNASCSVWESAQHIISNSFHHKVFSDTLDVLNHMFCLSTPIKASTKNVEGMEIPRLLTIVNVTIAKLWSLLGNKQKTKKFISL
jgi:hypothetical protein